MKEVVSNTIFFRFTNKFTKQFVLIVETPYIPFLAVDGYYSKFYKRIKNAAAYGCEKHLISGKKWFESKKTKRTIITFPNRASIDMPYDVSDRDIKIIKHHLEGIKMSLK